MLVEAVVDAVDAVADGILRVNIWKVSSRLIADAFAEHVLDANFASYLLDWCMKTWRALVDSHTSTADGDVRMD